MSKLLRIWILHLELAVCVFLRDLVALHWLFDFLNFLFGKIEILKIRFYRVAQKAPFFINFGPQKVFL